MTTGNGATDTPLWSFWIDRGGTFTDVIGRDGAGRTHSLKLLSTSDAYPDAAVEGMRRLLGVTVGQPFPAGQVAAIKMGTTVATNALLERKGARTAFITTKGFADSLVLGDQTRPSLFALDIEKPAPLYARVVEANERLGAKGDVVTALDRDALTQALRAAVRDGCTSAAIAFLHSDLNPAHEIAAGEAARKAGFSFVALSHQVSPLPRFIPRAETTVTDANLVLGRIDPAAFPAVFGPNHDRPLDLAAARSRLSLLAAAMRAPSLEAAAEGFIAVAVEQTAQAIRRISTERGFDPRGHALVAFGGAAGQIAPWVAEALGSTEILCPRYGSLLSAWGIGQASLRALRQAGVERPLDTEGLVVAVSSLDALTIEVEADLAAQGAAGITTRRRLLLRYEGADAALPVADAPIVELRAAFAAAHQRLFGFTEPSVPILIASVEVEGEEPAADASAGPADTTTTPSHAPTVNLFARGVAFEAPIVAAETMRLPVEGPALIVRGDTQIVVAPGWRARAERDGLIRLKRVAYAAHLSQTDADHADPVTLELFNRRFMGVAEAMGAALERTAHSVNIKERLDFSCALFDADGGLVANAPHMPVHLGSMGASVRAVRERHPNLLPGEAFALNNPYAGGTHLPDITVVMPVFLPDELEPRFFLAARGHHADVGGIQPGSMPPFSHTIDEEGVMLDALPIMRGKVFLEHETRAALVLGRWPARSPSQNIADLKAQIAACQAGAAAVREMIDTYGGEAVARYMGHVQANAEACVRRAIGRLADGAARVPMDGGGEIVVRIAVDAERGEATLDFTGSSDVLPTNFNAPSAIVDAAALYVFRTLVDDDIPLNAGGLKPLNIITPPGSMLAPTAPAAVVAGNVETSQHIVDGLYAALGVMANAQGSMNNFTFGDARRQYYETLCGGAGATERADGASGVHTHMTNSRLTDPEILERRFAVRVEVFALRPGSGGSGKHRGGDGVLRRIRFLATMEAALLSTRREHAPRGVAGGSSAKPGRQRLITAAGGVKDLPGCFSVTVQPGDAIEIETPGGGGFGPSDIV